MNRSFSRLLAASALAVSAAVAAPALAQSTTLNFTGLNTTYGDGLPLGANMAGNGQYLSYTESGYVLTLQTANPAGTSYGAHIGDGTSVSNTFNWHDNGDNLAGAFVSLTKVGGGLFNLESFDYSSVSGVGLTVSAGAYAPLLFTSSSSGTATPDFNGVSSVTFASTGYNGNQLDNVVLSPFAGAVPESATWSMMILGMGAVGFSMRRRQKVTTRVSYAG